MRTYDLCAAGYTGVKRDSLQELIQKTGQRFTKTLSRENTHLICLSHRCNPPNYEHKRVCESANIAKRHVEQVTGACLGGGVMVGAWAAGRSTILCLYMIRLSILCLYMKLVTFLRGLGQRAEVPVGGGVGAARGVAPVAHGLGGALRVAARGALRLPRSPPVRPPSCAARDSPARGPPAVAHQDVPRAAWALR